jgi:hypothetical protein
MDYTQAFILSSSFLALVIFWKMGVYKRLYDTILYIRQNGWVEYRKARKRYDEHMRLQSYGDAKYNKRNEIKQINARKKVKK